MSPQQQRGTELNHKETEMHMLPPSNQTNYVLSCNAKSNLDLPIIPLKFKNTEAVALIDTGANISLIHPDLVCAIKQHTKINYISHNVKIHTLNNNTIPFTSAATLTFKIKDKWFKNTFFITKHAWHCKYNVILGFDFLKRNNVIFNAANNSLKIGRLSINIHEINTVPEINAIYSTKPQNFAKAAHNICIAPFSSELIQLKIPHNVKAEEFILIQLPNLININIPQALHTLTADNHTYTIVHNNTETNVFIRKDTKLASIDMNKVDFVTPSEAKHYQVNNLQATDIDELRKQEISPSDFDLSHLPQHQKQTILNMLLSNYSVFSKSYQTLGSTDKVKPQFKLLHDFPLQTKPYPIPNIAKTFAKNEIKSLLEAGIIEPSSSSYAFPVLFVRKKLNPHDDPSNPKFRMVVDYRLLNDITESFKIQLPKITDILQQISGNNYYCVLDLKSAFFQILLQQHDREKLAFCTELGNFQPTRLPFGSKNSTSYFHTLMNKCLGDLKGKSLQFFLDDVIVAGNSIPKLLNTLQLVFDKLKQFNLTLDPAKLQLFQTQINYLGYTLDKNGFCPSQSNINKVNEFPTPKSLKEVKTFLGMTNYFRHLIHNYAEIVQPLVNLTKKDTKFFWSTYCQNAFDTIQELILKKPTLQNIDPNKEFFLITDASKLALSAILMQKDDNDHFKPIQFFSKQLNAAEMRYPSIKLELYAIFSAVKHFHDFLYAKPFTILTDAKALTFHLSLDKQPDIIARWLLYLQQFQYSISHIKGSINPADFLSRVTHTYPDEPLVVNNIFTANSELNHDNILKEQLSDTNLSAIIEQLKSNDLKCKKKYFLHKDSGLLCKKSKNCSIKSIRICIPKSLINSCISTAHSPHFGIHKTYNLIKNMYFWHGMFSDIKNFCETCQQCLKHKSKILNSETQFVHKGHLYPGECIAIDIVGKLPRSTNNHSFILTIIDHYSRFLEAIPLASITSKTIISTLNKYFSSFGIPKVLISDNGSAFVSQEFQLFLKSLNISHNKTSIYHPQSNGLLERVHRTLKESIASMSSQVFEWEQRLLYFKLFYNNATHSATGFTPAELFFGRELNTPITMNSPPITAEDYSKFVEKQQKHIQESRKIVQNYEKTVEKRANKKIKNTSVNFNVEDTVFLKSLISPTALAPKFQGPYKILKEFRNQNFLIQKLDDPSSKPIKIHANKLHRVPVRRVSIS